MPFGGVRNLASYLVAWEYFGRHGDRSASVLRRLAEAAERAGDVVAAQTWQAVAEAAERIFSG